MQMPAGCGQPKTVKTYSDCVRRCDRCGVAVSNSRNDPTLIFRDPLMNVPGEVRKSLDRVLGFSLNATARESKRIRLGFSTSEDAVTGTIFGYLQMQGTLGAAVGRLIGGAADVGGEPDLLLWGAPLSDAARLVRQDLIAVSDGIGEGAEFRSEPDVILVFGEDLLVQIEVKYRRGTNLSSCVSKRAYQRYVRPSPAFADRQAVVASGCYELTRNWRVGWDLADRMRARAFCLLNLASAKLLHSEGAALDQFECGLAASTSRRFIRRTWSELLNAIPRPWETWFAEYVEARRLACTSSAVVERSTSTGDVSQSGERGFGTASAEAAEGCRFTPRHPALPVREPAGPRE